MTSLKVSADSLIAEVTAALKSSLHGNIAPIIKKITDAVAELAAAVGHTPAAPAAATAARRPGRPRKAAAAAAKPAPAAAPARGRGKKNPRGATRLAIGKALAGSKKAISLAEIRNRLLVMPEFRGRNPKILYTQIVQAMKKMTEVQKTAGGLYLLRAGKGAK